MTMPTDIGAIDLMIGFPKADASKTYDYLRQTTHAEDESTREFPAGYMFKDVPNRLDEGDDGVDGDGRRDGQVGRRRRDGRGGNRGLCPRA